MVNFKHLQWQKTWREPRDQEQPTKHMYDERKLEHRQKYKHYKSTLERKRDVINDLDKSISKGIKDEEIEAEIEETSEFTDTINLTLIALEEAKISKENEGKNVENASQPEIESSPPLEEGNHNTSSISIELDFLSYNCLHLMEISLNGNPFGTILSRLLTRMKI